MDEKYHKMKAINKEIKNMYKAVENGTFKYQLFQQYRIY